jgi:hypothetical protein
MQLIKRSAYWLLILIYFLGIAGCRKKPIPYNPCQTGVKPKPVVCVQAMLSDSVYASDTLFNNNRAVFSTPETYDQYYWNIGSDPRTFTSQDFSLIFAKYTGSVLVKFRGQKAPNTLCFPGDDGMYEDTQRVVLVSQFTPPITISPLRGKYKGAFDDTRYDSIEFSIDYYDSVKYNNVYTGSQQFYWLNGFPKGFYNTSTTAYVYPELRNGMDMEIGYRSFEAGYKYSIATYGRIKGWLVNDDTLIILTKYQSESYRRFVALRNE